ncbi:MAG: hypothetical protein JXR52_11705 [Bacteroidales bacterium]|nr:hypothetical protein [Bacteroidales bacterium]
MKKYAFLVYHDDYHDFLSNLGQMGVLHVIEREDVDKEEPLQELRKYLARVDKVLGLPGMEGDQKEVKDAALSDAGHVEKLLGEIEAADEEINRLHKRLEEVNREIDRTLPWGEYDRDDLAKLEAAGYSAKFFQCTSNQFDPAWEEQYNLFLINSDKGRLYFMILLEEGERADLNAEVVEPSRKALSALKAEASEIEKEIRKAEERMEKLKKSAPADLMSFRRQLNNEINFKSVYLETRKSSDEKLRILEGWVPAEAEERLNAFLEQEAVVSLVTRPSPDERPPVELKNSWFSRLFEPISRLFDLPSYDELDLTPFFAPFFVLFFGFCLGDAGYGVFFLIFAGLLKLKAKKDLKPILTLAQFLGGGAIIFGILSGTFFGINLIDSGYTITGNTIENLQNAEVPAGVIGKLDDMEGVYYKSRSAYLEALKQNVGAEQLDRYQTEFLKQAEAGIPMVRSFRHLMQDPLSMFYLSIIIGGIQIIFGQFVRILNITRSRGFKYSLATIGWLVLFITLILYATGILKGGVLNYVFYALLGLAGVLILLLNNPDRNVFARVGSGLWDSYSMVTGVFGDLLSYIRLFALGISSAILGFVFNDISLQLLNIPYIGWLFFLIILLFGHSINLFLATLGGFVHPMRLTFVEFYKNAGFKGGGKKYNPFIINN